GDWEVILVDDCGPEDGTREAVESLAREHPSRRIEYIRNEQNVGCSHTRNIAMAGARGEFLAFLDPDDYWGPRQLEIALQSIGDADLCFTRGRCVDERGSDLGPHMGGRMDELVAAFPRSMFRENFLLIFAAVIRHDYIRKVGGFITREHALVGEDWDFYLRCIAAGARFVFSAEECCYYRRYQGSLTSDYLGSARDCVRVVRRNRRTARGIMRRDLTDALHERLCWLAYLLTSFRDWDGLRDMWEALRLKPFDVAPFVQVAKGLRNNWKSLR
ncbi:MAG: glycosyltransferase, partial [Chthoniobacterales bacterium]|nr:glycosyltransferase [Chthoniobacterales bacterium]